MATRVLLTTDEQAIDTHRLGYRPALDGLRAVAVGLVIADHARLPGFIGGGTIGVTLFFVLSGYLITSLLVAEREATGRVDLRGFYRRRAVRLLPALFVVLAVVVPLLVILDRPGAILEGLAVAFYTGNWLLAGGFDMGPLNHTWSLAIEEQFYIALPLLMLPALLVLRQRWMALMALALALAIAAWRGALLIDGATWNRLWAGTDTRADALLMGVGLALLGVSLRSRWTLWLPVALAILLLAAIPHEDPRLFVVGLPLAVGASALAVVMAWNGARWLAWRPLRSIGRMAYGLYLWNLPAAYLARLWFGDAFSLASALTQVTLTIVAAAASWYLLEQPAQRRWRSATNGDTNPVPGATIRLRPGDREILLD